MKKSFKEMIEDIRAGKIKNLRGADLSHTNLTGANLRGADLTGANLTDTIF